MTFSGAEEVRPARLPARTAVMPSSKVNRSKNHSMSTGWKPTMAEADPYRQGNLRCPVRPDQALENAKVTRRTLEDESGG